MICIDGVEESAFGCGETLMRIEAGGISSEGLALDVAPSAAASS